MPHVMHQWLPWSTEEISCLLLFVTQFFRVDDGLFLVMPPLSDADVFDHPGINTCISNIFDIFDIVQLPTVHVFQIIFDIFDVCTINSVIFGRVYLQCL